MRYHTPASFEEASAIAAGSTGITRFLAGGTDVLVQLRAGTLTPDTLIDTKHIAGARDIIRTPAGGWQIGVAVSGAEMSEHAGLGRDWPGVVEAMGLVGSTQIQGRATLTGNLCNGSPAADSVPALVAAGATVSVVGPDGARKVAVGDIPLAPGRISLVRGEVVTAVNLPARDSGPGRGGDAYLRFTPRTEMDIAVVGCAVNLRVDGGRITEARVSLGAVAPTVLLVGEAGQAITGTDLDEAALGRLVAAVRAACRPIDDMRGTIEFRTRVAGVLARRVARIAHDRALAAGEDGR